MGVAAWGGGGIGILARRLVCLERKGQLSNI